MAVLYKLVTSSLCSCAKQPLPAFFFVFLQQLQRSHGRSLDMLLGLGHLFLVSTVKRILVSRLHNKHSTVLMILNVQTKMHLNPLICHS
jgi:hypothetical protein